MKSLSLSCPAIGRAFPLLLASLSILGLLHIRGVLQAQDVTQQPDQPKHGADSADAVDLTNRSKQKVRFATFNVSFHRGREGMLRKSLASGKGKNFIRIARTIQQVRPDVLLLNEFDYDQKGEGIDAFCKNYLAVSHGDQQPIEYPHRYFSTVNTGVDSGNDLDNDGTAGTPNDAFGYGKFPGQYGMVVLSKYPFLKTEIRTFQKFLWKDMPDNLMPNSPDTGQPWYTPDAAEIFRLSSKSHWDLPVNIDGAVIHLLCSHPTPPTFDGPEDKNGRRNHDEIRLWADYVSGDATKAGYLIDDAGQGGGLASGASFVIVGDLNADPLDGDSTRHAINQLLEHPEINAAAAPSSQGGVVESEIEGRKNREHQGDPKFDTADFGDSSVGNLRIDYVLPSKNLTVVEQQVFWPHGDDPAADWVKATDHHMVYVDIEVAGP